MAETLAAQFGSSGSLEALPRGDGVVEATAGDGLAVRVKVERDRRLSRLRGRIGPPVADDRAAIWPRSPGGRRTYEPVADAGPSAEQARTRWSDVPEWTPSHRRSRAGRRSSAEDRRRLVGMTSDGLGAERLELGATSCPTCQ